MARRGGVKRISGLIYEEIRGVLKVFLRYGNHSYGTLANIEDMKDYYKNLTMEDVMEVIDINSFSDCEFTFNPKSYDLYFYGIKNT